MVVRDIFRGGTALLGACRIFASRPIILLPALFRLPLLALVLRWLYDTLLWVLPDVLLRAAVSVEENVAVCCAGCRHSTGPLATKPPNPKPAPAFVIKTQNPPLIC